MHLPDPDFPPILTAYPVKAPAHAFETACRRAAAGELGAADLVWARSTERAELALVLEPEVARTQALQMKPLLFVAIADCIGGLMPPKTAVHLRWPDTILLNGAAAGDIQFAIAPSAAAEVPGWLVIGARIQVTSPHVDREPGEASDITSIHDECGTSLNRTEILRSLSAHILSWLHVWQDDGFRPVSDRFVPLIEGYETDVELRAGDRAVGGRVLGLTDEMQLLVKLADGGTVVLGDPSMGEPTDLDAVK